ncbi:GntR family transcriptional regulator [Roseibium aggregatum]|uniref:GntR family transcriptional regulator n=1 Tax=Roseibium aggregatum TaxID=187304 RepID=A0A939EFD5_9HYPH|nr:GntR family transcriptional regulator [Roseibium aggregatum]MBN9672226.1 GntR family transcriptional regulator [Roseibium aggregatum]
MVQSAPESKSERIARVLEAEIRSGTLNDGDSLSSEKALVERFSVSRTTIRKGLGILAAKNLIRTKVGIGSFVTFGGTVIDSGPGWSVALSDHNANVSARILRIARMPMDLETPDSALDGDILAVDRIRFREETGKVLTLERARVPWRDDLSPVLESGLEHGSLSKTLQARGLMPAKGEEWANVLPALSENDARLMGRSPGEPMLRLQRLTRSADDLVVEYVESLLDPTLFGLRMTF